MNLKIENIGIIKHADVKLNGLTVIAGENDSGKSTVGKLIFSIVKAANQYEQFLNGNKSDKDKVKQMIEDIYVIVRNIDHEISIHFQPNSFYEELAIFTQKDFFTESKFLHHKFNKIFTNKINIINDGSIELNKRVLPELNELKNYIVYGGGRNTLILRALQQVLFSEFYNQLSPKNMEEVISKAELVEGSITTFMFTTQNDKINELITDEILFFDDVTFIESPIILQMYDMIDSAATLLELSENNKGERINNFSKAKVSLHLKDLMNKLKNAHDIFTIDSQKKLLEIIADIIDGDFSFEEQEQDFSFTKKNGVRVKSVNTASGIKAFGIIQLLIQTGVIDSRSLLIVDEPETHLHPKWQVEYARLLVELVKNDISVLVTSHSPYLIQALKVFSDKEGVTDRTTFYLSEKNATGDFSEIHDVTKNLNPLFSKLAEAFKELV